MSRFPTFVLYALLCSSSLACVSPDGSTPEQQAASALAMRDEVLADLYQRKPEARAHIESAAGYVAYEGFALHPLIMTFANGYAVAVNNRTDEVSHLDFGRFGIGPGLAAKSIYAVIPFESESDLDAFKADRWGTAAMADAAFRFGDFGGSANAETDLGADTDIYMWTRTGFALEALVFVGKISPNEELNATGR